VLANAIHITGGSVQGASQFLIKDVYIRGPYVGFLDDSTVSYWYRLVNVQVTEPGSKGFSITGGGTLKILERPIINGDFAAGNNDGIYIENQANGITIIDPQIDGLHGRHLNFLSSTVRVRGGYFEHQAAVDQGSGNVMIFNSSDVEIDGLIDNGATLTVAGTAIILVQGATNLKLDSFLQKGQGIQGAVAVYGLRVDPATVTAATQVTVTNSPSIRTRMQENTGSVTIISDTTGRVKVIEPTKRIITAVATINAAGDQNLMTYTVPGSTIAEAGSIRVRAAGTIAGAGGVKTIALYFGAKYWVIKNAAAGTENWSIEVVISGKGTITTHKISGKSWVASTPTDVYEEWATEDFDDDLVLKCIGNVAVGTDVITQTLMEVEVL